jgi:hypothetical protein
MQTALRATAPTAAPRAAGRSPAAAARAARAVAAAAPRRAAPARRAVVAQAAPATAAVKYVAKEIPGDVGTAINAVRFLSIDGVNAANSGHPGLPMGCAPMATVLFSEYMKLNPDDPAFPDRDRFVLSAGHGSMLQYSLLHLLGYKGMTVRGEGRGEGGGAVGAAARRAGAGVGLARAAPAPGAAGRAPRPAPGVATRHP